MKEKYIQILGIFLTVAYGFFIAWLYWAEPKNLEEFSVRAKETIENTTTQGQVIIGTYEIDKAKFDDGLKAFRADNFVAARQFFENADPERRDANVQFYIAYSYYRQGFGKLSNDDELFKKGLEQLNRVTSLDRNFKSADADLQMKTPAELKNEFEEGLEKTWGDLNPSRLLRERK